MSKQNDDSGFGDKTVLKLEELIKQLQKNTGVNQNTFDTLLHKVDKIEEAQGIIVRKVDEVHHTLYHPDTGVFSRLQEIDSTVRRNQDVVNVKLETVSSKQLEASSELEEHFDISEVKEKRMITLEHRVDELTTWRDKFNKHTKWFIFTILGSVIGLTFKLLYDYFSTQYVFFWKAKK